MNVTDWMRRYRKPLCACGYELGAYEEDGTDRLIGYRCLRLSIESAERKMIEERWTRLWAQYQR